MNTEQFITAVAQETGISKTETRRILESVWKVIVTQCMTNGETVKIHGFGNFLPKSYKKRKGFKPVTKTPIDIPPTTRMGYKPAKALKRIDV